MQKPSIESILTRKEGRSHPVIKRLHDAPVVGHVIRSWMRATRASGAQALWVSLPPVTA